ncbi:hypothetical protein Dshi_2376 [Dinoroseobacter shibae DFL 12 = DSM 16493]|uniref:Uncharacterized protein n=1 Tax=Dinoroseobacter shibae (strain DSM 16493 / NCIMB 14021 / DFL 12) TaxID=398580 RepID=A8LRT1_DINSH|nr:hypothetical protein [Dinoroseobacter shibae]ABV94112.1 hypothetical protein Dshi_2376 [Dinoroseobacter shibae DFL 12 = DSM 16493]URF45554.1 hypothetical protein M8008_12280 [Dinoroseobacter shibae]URF49859.1 hypothetical protein M8007_12280 [Dinoroseobacter shibae]
MHFPQEGAFDDDRTLLKAFVRAYGDHLGIILGFRASSTYRMPVISDDLGEVLGPAGWKQIEDDLEALIEAIDKTSDDGKLLQHGLLGRHLRFKIAALNHREARLYQGGNFVFNPLFGRSVGNIADTIIDSALDATGAGTTLREIGDIASDVIGDVIDS